MLFGNTEYWTHIQHHGWTAAGCWRFQPSTKVGGMQGLAGQGSMAQELNQKKHERLQQLRALRQDTRDSGLAWPAMGRVWRAVKQENWKWFSFWPMKEAFHQKKKRKVSQQQKGEVWLTRKDLNQDKGSAKYPHVNGVFSRANGFGHGTGSTSYLHMFTSSPKNWKWIPSWR